MSALGGVCLLLAGGCVCLLLAGGGGGVSATGGSAPGGVWSQGGVCSRGCLLWGGVWSWGMCGIPACIEADTPTPPVDRQMPVKT